MSAWDSTKKVTFKPGSFKTSGMRANVRLHSLGAYDKSVRLSLGTYSGTDSMYTQLFNRTDLTEMIEFLTELRDSIE